jgi:hypothetical protein
LQIHQDDIKVSTGCGLHGFPAIAAGFYLGSYRFQHARYDKPIDWMVLDQQDPQ